jgi:hypothetical protein
MKKILFVSAPVLALISQNAFAEETKKDEKVFSFYGSLYATQGLYSSEVAKARDALTTVVDEFRPGVKANFGSIKADVQFEMAPNLSGDAGKDWDVNDAAIKIDPETGGTADADNIYKSLWNSTIRKAYFETALPTGCTLKAGLIRPTGASSNGFYYSTGLEGYGNGIGATLAHAFDFGAVKVTPELTMLNKAHLATTLTAPAASPYNVTPNDKALHVAVTGTVAEKTAFALAYSGNYNSTTAAGVNHIEASVAHTLDAINAGVWVERNAYHVNADNYGNVLKFGIDAGYAFNDNLKAIAGFAQTQGFAKAGTTETEDKALNEFFVGPRYTKDSASAELGIRYAMDSDKPFVDSDKKAVDNAASAWATLGYDF